jgi:hypothetical protein
MWGMMRQPLAIAMEAKTQFSRRVYSCGFFKCIYKFSGKNPRGHVGDDISSVYTDRPMQQCNVRDHKRVFHF